MKSTDNFKETIQNYLLQKSNENDLLKDALSDESKTIDNCIIYILNTVQKSGCNGFEDDEIYLMALEYYLSDNIEIGNPNIKSQVIINRMPVLTEEEKAAAKQKAIEDLIKDEKQKIIKKSSNKVTNQSTTPTLF